MRLSPGNIRQKLSTVPRWKLRNREIWRAIRFRSFAEGVRFVNRVAKLADRAWHHPDIDIRYDRVKLRLTTHDEGGLTNRDFDLARKIDRFAPNA